MRSRRAIIVFITFTAIALAADLLSKHYVFQQLMPSDDALAPRIKRIQANAKINIGRELDSREMLHQLNLKHHACPGLDLTLSVNKGAVFGMELHESGSVHRLIVSIATLVVTLLMAAWFATSHRKALFVHLATALILAGALGNLYDRMASRVTLPGMDPILYNVRDFLDCSSIPFPFGLSYPWVFNVADVWLVVGVAMMLLNWIFASNSAKKTEPKTDRSKS